MGEGLSQVIVRRETFASGKHLVGKAVKDGGSGGVSTYRRALEDKCCAGLGKGPGSEDEERAASAVGGLTETEPSGERDAIAVLGRRRGEIEHKGGKATGLEEKISGAEGLVESLEAERHGIGKV
jgi:hypothetical protein